MNDKRAPLDRAATKRLLAEPPPGDKWELYQRMAAPEGDALSRYDTKGGKLYRRRGQELTPIRDFTGMEFEPIRAPYDWRDPPDGESGGWHPLDGEGT